MKDTKPTNPKDVIGSSKVPIHLFPKTAIVAGAMAMLHGAMNYGRSNWRVAGVRASIYEDAKSRHMDKWFEGEDIDPDSGLPHLYHALACIALLIDAIEAGKLNDDRMVQGGYIDMINRLTPEVARIKEEFKDKDVHHYTIQDNKEEENE